MFTMFIVKYDDDQELNMQKLFYEGLSAETMNRIYNNKVYKNALMVWLPFFNERGFLDQLIAENTGDKN